MGAERSVQGAGAKRVRGTGRRAQDRRYLPHELDHHIPAARLLTARAARSSSTTTTRAAGGARGAVGVALRQR
eukprot:3327061-Prymnesium_polylepis.1